mmetsp:Transcript_135015/g.269446  ORF Transcript_135015/g.269446 Transcript_135015/m.269446 type:complete len:349 (-) Transcript_135015:51-1097(-)
MVSPLQVGRALLSAVVEAQGSRQVVAATTASLFRLLVPGAVLNEMSHDEDSEDLTDRMTAIKPVVRARMRNQNVSGQARAKRNVAEHVFGAPMKELQHQGFTRVQRGGQKADEVRTGAKRSELMDALPKVSAKLEQATSKTATLSAEIKQLAAELAALANQQAEMDKFRQEKNAPLESARPQVGIGAVPADPARDRGTAAATEVKNAMDKNFPKAAAEAHHKASGSIEGNGGTSAADYDAVNAASMETAWTYDLSMKPLPGASASKALEAVDKAIEVRNAMDQNLLKAAAEAHHRDTGSIDGNGEAPVAAKKETQKDEAKAIMTKLNQKVDVRQILREAGVDERFIPK